MEHLDLPVFKPSTSDAKASQIKKVPSIEEKGDNPTQKDTLRHDLVTGMGSLSLALSLGTVSCILKFHIILYLANVITCTLIYSVQLYVPSKKNHM